MTDSHREASPPLPRLTLGLIGASVLLLYVLVLAGTGSPFWSALLAGRPVGVEAFLDEEDAASASRLDSAFERMGYRLDAVARGSAGVPPVFLSSIPGDLGDMEATDAKKAVFLRVMLPLVLTVNEEIAADRRRLEGIVKQAGGRPPAGDDEPWVAELAERYGTPSRDLKALLKRVDVVPPSLALAQAAEESGWGTSRFAREGNNLYGHIAAGDEGMVPSDDQSGPRLRAFSTLHEAVRAYIHNLNTHPAYETLRRTRAGSRGRGTFPDGHSLAGALASYSERGPAYVDTIRTLIRANRLLRLDHARLRPLVGGRVAILGSEGPDL